MKTIGKTLIGIAILISTIPYFWIIVLPFWLIGGIILYKQKIPNLKIWLSLPLLSSCLTFIIIYYFGDYISLILHVLHAAYVHVYILN